MCKILLYEHISVISRNSIFVRIFYDQQRNLLFLCLAFSKCVFIYQHYLSRAHLSNIGQFVFVLLFFY